MDDSRIDELITELRSLRFQVARLESEVVAQLGSNNAPIDSAPVRHYQAERASTQILAHGHVTGDRIRVLNKIKKPATWNNAVQWCEVAARTATVTEVRETQIFFETDNDVHTWRAPNNLRRIADQHE
jgi:hypothetical protein